MLSRVSVVPTTMCPLHNLTRLYGFPVAEKLKQEGRQEIFQNETMEEMEDDEGNVYNKKTYEDLKKQGII